MAASANSYVVTTGYTVSPKGHGQAYALVEAADKTFEVPKGPKVPPPVTGRAVLTESLELDIDAGALVRSVQVSLTAAAAGEVNIGDVATVRSDGDDPTAASKVHIIDFNGLRTISSIIDAEFIGKKESSAAKASVWLGSAFASYPVPISQLGEVMTERIRLEHTSAEDPEAIANNWRVRLPAPPQSVEIRVNGSGAWVGLLGAQADGPGAQTIDAEVDITSNVAAAAQAGDVPVVVELTSPTPADLGLSFIEDDVLSRYQVGFPEGATRKVNATSEGLRALDLPLDGIPAADAASIRRLELTIHADVPETRVEPATGPTPSNDADVEMTVDRSLLVRLPASMVSEFEELNAVRVGVIVEEECEFGGGILASSPTLSGQPGDAIEGLVLGPALASPPTVDGEMQWVSLPLSEPYELDGSDVWVSLTVARGRAALCLALESADTAATDILWRAPSGFYRSLSFPSEIPPLVGAVRAVGTPADTRPVGSVQIELRDLPGARVVADPPASGQRVVLDLGDTSVSARNGQLPVDLLAVTPGDFTIEQVDIFYSTKGST